jgi:hypothetical protein
MGITQTMSQKSSGNFVLIRLAGLSGIMGYPEPTQPRFIFNLFLRTKKGER